MKNNIIKILLSLVILPVFVHAEQINPTPAPSVAPQPQTTTAPAVAVSTASVGPETTQPTGSVTNYPSSTNSTASVGPASTVSTATVGQEYPVTPVTPPSNGGSNGGSSGGSTGGSSSGSPSSGSSSSGGSYIGFYGCPMITTYMKFGANNNTIEVTKLQNFLKNIEKLDVDVNGIFDRKTEKAVIAFQNKYSSTIMGPWSTNQGTGFVYITTQKQINKIACNLPLTLNANELAIINNARTVKSATKSVSKTEVIMTPKNEAEVIMTEVKINETQAISTSTDSNKDQTASVSKPSIMKRFVNFIIYLFK